MRQEGGRGLCPWRNSSRGVSCAPRRNQGVRQRGQSISSSRHFSDAVHERPAPPRRHAPSLRAQRSNPGRGKALEVAIGMASAAHPRPIAESGRGPAGSLDCRAAVIASAAKQSRAWQGARGVHRHGFRCGFQPCRGKWSRTSRFAGLPRRYAPRSDGVRGDGVRGDGAGLPISGLDSSTLIASTISRMREAGSSTSNLAR